MYSVKLIILDVNCYYLILTPFYAKHLQALKDAGIMTNISDPNATEMRGWVMLMLERAAETVNPSECNDPAVLLACSLGSDSCPAACKANEETTVDENGNKVVVKSGDLSIVATAAEGKKVVKNGISELDTITLKASEAITLNSVTLERYGLSAYGDINEVWLENVNGERISQGEKSFNSKDIVTLTIKKEYRNLESEDAIIVVVSTNAATTASSLGVKVTSVESSAKNLDISNYSPYLYDMVSYTSSTVTIVKKGKDSTTYHYEADKSYEIGRFQVKAGNAAILVNGFTLSNVTNGLDLDKYLDNVTISLSDGTAVKNVSWNVNKDEELKASFDDVSIGINKNAIFVIEATFKDLDKYNQAVQLTFKNTDSLNVQEEKSGVRANFANGVALGAYTFQGGKIEVSNEKLSDNIDAAAWSTDVVIGKGKITLNGESIQLYWFNVSVTAAGIVNSATSNPTTDQDPEYAIEELKMIVGGEEFTATPGAISTNNTRVYTFPKIDIDETSNIEFVVDLRDNGYQVPAGLTDAGVKVTLNNAKLTFNNDFSKWTNKIGANNTATSTWEIWKYVDARSIIWSDDFAGSISISNVRLQPAKGSLTNTAKDQEYLVKQTSRKTIFDGTYAAQKQDISLNEFAVRLSDTNVPSNTMEITYYLSIDGKEVGSFEYAAGRKATNVGGTNATAENDSTDESFLTKYPESFSNILIKKGEKVSVKLEANVKADNLQKTYAPILILRWEDKDGNAAGLASEYTSKIKVVSAGSVTVSESAVTPKQSVEVADNNVTIARFIVKSSKNTEGMELNHFVLSYVAGSLAQNNLRVKVAWEELVAAADFVVAPDGGNGGTCYDVNTLTADTTNDTKAACDTAKKTWAPENSIVVAGLSEEIPSEGVDVEVIAKTATAWTTYTYTLANVNGSNPGTKFSKKVLASVASIKTQENLGDSTTKFTFAVDKDTNNTAITNLVLFTANWPENEPLATVEEGTTLELTNANNVRFITAIGYWCTEAASVPAGKTYKWEGIAPTEGSGAGKCATVITKSDFRDFFKVGDSEAQVFRTK